ncbi:hypothetical protein [Kitasatospora sp. NBC_00315]|uniref:hypothetical protein n=1 Tax=Kitasatospora sp. NBC_00315 TaxID=2975963 RepID=UPI00325624ED
MSGGWPVVAEAEAVMGRVRFPGPAEAAAALVRALRGVEMGPQQRAYAEGCLIGAGAAEYLERRLDRAGEWTLTVHLLDRSGTRPRWVGRELRISLVAR